mgnify:CR=1 FL=1
MTPKARRLDMHEQANAWRTIADGLYARWVFKNVILASGWEEDCLAEIAEELSTLRIPHVRGEGRKWTDKDVSRLLARVAAMANGTDKPEIWAAKMSEYDYELEAVDYTT